MSEEKTQPKKITGTEQAKKLIVIGGGVGPAAGNAAHDQLIRMTDNGIDKDQGHASVIQLSFSGSVTDRTLWLRSQQGPNPGGEMAKAVNWALEGFLKHPGNMVLGIPCNTFHAPPIWEVFIKNLINPHKRIAVVNMIEETAKAILKRKDYKKNSTVIGLLSTSGTRDSRVYQDILKKQGIEKVATLEDTQQEHVMTAIYDKNYGIKGQNPDMPKALELINDAIVSLQKKGATIFILGCTELPLPYLEVAKDKKIPDNCLDPANILIKQLILQSGNTLKQEYATGIVNNDSAGKAGTDYLNLEDDGIQSML